MKKYLMSGLAAIAICAAFTSCSKNNDVFDPNAAPSKQQTPEEKITSSYEKAFEDAFGKPASNQDWGLSKYGTPKASTRSIITEINDPFTYYQNTANLYKTEVPKSAKTLDDFKPWGNDVIDENSLQNCTELSLTAGTYGIHLWTNKRDIYISGNVTLNVDNGKSINQARFYILPDATLNLNMSSYINDLEIYVASTGILNYNFDKLYKQDGGGIIFNAGTMNLQENFEANQNSIVYNEGTINGTNITSKPQDTQPSYFYNYGVLALDGDMQLNSCSNFFNEGTVTVAGETSCTQQKIWWINKGHYTTGSLTFSAYNETFYNYCNLICTGHMKMYTGVFHLMDNSYTEGGYANFGQMNFKVMMGNNAGVNIKGNVRFEKNQDGTEQGFFATGENAYVRIDGKAQVEKHKYVFVLDGKITYAIKEGVEYLEPYDDYYKPYFEFREGTTEVPADKFNQFTATPKATLADGCGATWNVPGEPEENITYQGRIMGEDLTAMSDNDFDFNDVVFDWAISADKKTAYIKLYAAGGTLPLKIGTAIGQGEEVHDLFQVSRSTMVNTGVGADGITKEPVEFTITKTSGTFESAADIIVSVDKTSKGANGYMQMTAKIGTAPCLLFVPLGTKWVDEYVNIEKAYTWFGGYVGGAGDQWTSAPVEKFVNLKLSDNN